MPVIGKDIASKGAQKHYPHMRIKEPVKKRREIGIVKATLVHSSTILPFREISHEVMDSVKRDGLQQPIIVRAHPTKPNEYEIIDGHNRFYGVYGQPGEPNLTHFMKGREPEILVDIRCGLTDSEVFKLADTLRKRKDRNTYEKAELYVKWIKAKAKELGEEKGALTAVAQEIILEDPNSPSYSYALNSKQSLLSQYVKIYRLFEKLEQKYPDKDFNALKSLAINKLYELTKLIDNPPKLIKVVEKLLQNLNMTLERLKLLTQEQILEPKTPWRPMIRLEEYEANEFKQALLKCNRKIFESAKTTSKILSQATKALIKLFIAYPENFEPEMEEDRRKGGHELVGFWMKDSQNREQLEK